MSAQDAEAQLAAFQYSDAQLADDQDADAQEALAQEASDFALLAQLAASVALNDFILTGSISGDRVFRVRAPEFPPSRYRRRLG